MNPGDNRGQFAVLYVDDEEKALKYFRMAYEQDFPVITATSVEQAMEILGRQAHEIGVLITDQRMPGQQGVDLLKQVRSQWPDIIRMLTTAYSDLSDAIEAVNSGEILRYVTKPWDIQALRAELRHAMDYFQLRRERDLLMQEKFSVRQRMSEMDRLRDLLVIAAGLNNLRHSHHALCAYAHDGAGLSRGRPASLEELELWGLTVDETSQLMSINDELQALDRTVNTGFGASVALDKLLAGCGMTVSGKVPEIAGDPDLLLRLCSGLARLARTPASIHLEAAEAESGGTAVRILMTGDPELMRSFNDKAMDESGNDLLAAYLITWHHGGSLRTEDGRDGVRIELLLPGNPAEVALATPETDWLERQFAQLESWD